ncbi:hypothetical protein D3C71_1692260 [compost metagenome]
MFDLAGGDHADLDSYLGPAVLEFGQGVGDAHVWQGHQIVGQADVELAAQVLVQAVDLGTKTLQGAEQLQCGLIDLATFLGQRKTRASTLAKAQAEALFQVVHLLADGRTADAQDVLCRRETPALDYAAVDFQQADVEIADLREGVGPSAHKFSGDLSED